MEFTLALEFTFSSQLKKILIIFYLIKLYIFSTINWYGVFS